MMAQDAAFLTDAPTLRRSRCDSISRFQCRCRAQFRSGVPVAGCRTWLFLLVLAFRCPAFRFAQKIIVRNNCLAVGSFFRRLGNNYYVFVNILEQKIWWVRIASKDGALLAVRTPLPACSVLRPNEFIDQNKPNVA